MNDYIVLDIETTGISPVMEAITEIGAVRIMDGQVVGTYNRLINPMRPIPAKITQLTGISDQMVAHEATIDQVMPEFLDFCGDLPILGHNVLFDFSFLKTNALNLGLTFDKSGLDTLVLSRKFLQDVKSHSLTNLIAHMRINRENAHRALDDAMATHELYQILRQRYHTPEQEKYFCPKLLDYKPKKTSPITPKQISFLNSLIRQHHVGIDYEVEALSKSEASKKIDEIIRTHGYRRF